MRCDLHFPGDKEPVTGVRAADGLTGRIRGVGDREPGNDGGSTVDSDGCDACRGRASEVSDIKRDLVRAVGQSGCTRIVQGHLLDGDRLVFFRARVTFSEGNTVDGHLELLDALRVTHGRRLGGEIHEGLRIREVTVTVEAERGGVRRVDVLVGPAENVTDVEALFASYSVTDSDFNVVHVTVMDGERVPADVKVCALIVHAACVFQRVRHGGAVSGSERHADAMLVRVHAPRGRGEHVTRACCELVVRLCGRVREVRAPRDSVPRTIMAGE